jgi:hypothetical protein
MKIRSSEQGVALIITLIMLSVVTVMAVLFLGVSRRERAAVTVTTDQITAKFMTEAAFARAEGDLVSRMLTASNVFNYDMLVSTNFLNINGFEASDFGFDSNNVNYLMRDGSILDRYRQAVNIGNLQFDPRPPVYIQTNFNANAPLDFRFFLDFNRNGRFEPTGLLPERGPSNVPMAVDGVPLYNNLVGDPQWIGMLEYPNQPHSATNRFIGRYAYLVLPEGKSLDLNAIHNQIKQPRANSDYFVRNQGVGPWEMNLAGFLADLNFNEWGGAGGYSYQRPISPLANQGTAFNDAVSMLSYRMDQEVLPSFQTLANPGNTLLQSDFVDQFANGPYLEEASWLSTDVRDDPRSEYWGSDYRKAFYDVQELFDPFKVSRNQALDDNFVLRLNRASSGRQQMRRSTYDRYTVYRLLSQLGVDSEVDEDARSMSLALLDGVPILTEQKVAKLSLNYNNQRTHQTNFLEWNPREFFIAAADRLVLANMNTNPPNFAITNRVGQRVVIPGTNFFTVGDTYVNRNFSVTNVQVWPKKLHGRHEYSANLHQLLQVAANISDVVTTNRPVVRFATDTLQTFPLVFRPRFQRDPNGTIRIVDYVEVGSDAKIQWSRPMRDLDFARDRSLLSLDDNVKGFPWIVAAKKGLPNFNEFGVLTSLEITRKLEINKTRANAPVGLWQTNQMMVLSVSNIFGLESWNSYTNSYPRPLQIQALVECSLAITNERGQILATNRMVMRPDIINIPANTWSNRQFRLPLYTNYTPVASAAYNHMLGRLIPVVLDNRREVDGFFPDRGFPVGQIGIAMTNHVQCVMYDPEFNRIVDIVNLDDLGSGFDVTQEVIGEVSLGGQTSESAAFWSTNRLGGVQDIFAPTEGVLSQIFASLGELPVSNQLWNSYVGRGAGRDREEAMDLFRAFLGFPPRFLSPNALSDAFQRLRDPRKSFVRQVPFTPSVRKSIYQTWQANDPLVHYMVEDLQDNEQLSSQSLFIMPGQRVPVQNLHNLGIPGVSPGQLNRRYRPWPAIQGAAPLSYNMAHKDPLVRQSDDWQFPTNKFPNIGWLGRIHRGTPWQTIYLKSYLGTDGNGRMLTVNDLPNANRFRTPDDGVNHPFQTLSFNANTGDEVVDVDPNSVSEPEKINNLAIARLNWFRWSGSFGTHPTNDWKILEQFTTAVNDNASRGLLSVNQAGLAAWSAALSGVTVQTNVSPTAVSLRDLDGIQPTEYRSHTVQPAGLFGMPGFDTRNSPLAQIVNGTNGINATRSRFAGGRFRTLGDVLATPALSVQSPFTAWTNGSVFQAGLDDLAIERIPQQILSLLKADEPRVTIYAYGQSLRPAEQSLRTEPAPPRLFNICTNYQITGEFVAKRVLRFDGSVTNLSSVVESEIVIPAD